MRSDDGKCHLCRRWPVGQSPLYSVTACENCEVTDRVRAYDVKWWRFWWWFRR